MKDCVAKRLKEARLVLGVSQKKLGILAGMDEYSAGAQVSQYEMGKYTPNLSTLLRIAVVSNHPIEYFFSKDDTMAEAICLMGRLSESARSKLLAKVKTWVLESDDDLFVVEE